nr:MAG TPA: hypothetical protein [Caudoviricetes sp.]
MYRGRTNHSDTVKSVKIGQSAAKSFPTGNERFNDYLVKESTAQASWKHGFSILREDIVWTYAKT